MPAKLAVSGTSGLRHECGLLAREFDLLAIGEATEWYAGQGIPVFPLVPRSKRPLTEHGFGDATAELEQVRA